MIAEILFKSKDIERWGSGLKRIVDECVESGIRVDFKALKSGFLVIFHRQPMLAFSPSTEEKTTGKTTGKTGAKARDRVLALIRANPEITVKQLAEVIGLSTHGVDWHIRKLKQQGWLKRIGSRKAGRWEVLG